MSDDKPKFTEPRWTADSTVILRGLHQGHRKRAKDCMRAYRKAWQMCSEIRAQVEGWGLRIVEPLRPEHTAIMGELQAKLEAEAVEVVDA